MASHTSGWWISGSGSQPLSVTLRTDVASSELGDGTVDIAVSYSAVNYKDALALQGSPGVVRTSPLIPGIDAVGTVTSCTDGPFTAGDSVILTGWGYGEQRHGGLATNLRANPEHLISLPPELSPGQAATIGTAGFTAALAVAKLQGAGVTPDSSNLPIAVTGAAGAVGSCAVYLLAEAGFEVTAITGRTEEEDYLRSLGAHSVVSRQEILTLAGKPLAKEQFAGVLDQAGGTLLATVLSMLAADGVAVASGLAGGSDLPTTVMPFILRGVNLLGVNSVTQPLTAREEAWGLWARHATRFPWDSVTNIISLSEARETAATVIAGATRGRVVVDVNA